MTNGLEKLTYGKPATKEEKKRFLQSLTGAKEPVGGFIGRRYEEPEFKQKPLYGVLESKEPKTTESREYVQGQISEEEWQRSQETTQMKTEYKKVLSQIYTKTEDLHRIGGMELPELEEAWNSYQEWEAQRHQEQITEFGKQLGLDATMVKQLQSVYPEEELAPKMQVAGMIKTLLGTKHASASLVQQFNELMFPEVEEEEEPTAYDYLKGKKLHEEITGEEGLGVPLEEMRLDVSEEFDPRVGSMIQDVIEAYQELGENPPDLLNAIRKDFEKSYGITMSDEEAGRRINWILQERLGITVDFGLGEETTTSEAQPEKTTLLKRILGIGG